MENKVLENDSEVMVFLVDKQGEIDKRTRREVRAMLQEPADRAWDSAEILNSLDNAGLIDFETREGAEKYADEVKAELTNAEE